MKKNKRILLTFIAIASMFILQSYSGGYTLSNEAVNPTANSCSTLGCHSAASEDAASTYVQLKDINDNIVSEYIPNVDYKVEVILKKVQGSLSSPKAGFQASILNAANASAGAITSVSTLYIGIDNINGVELARQNSSNAGSFLSNDTIRWTYNWTAPAQGTGTLKMNVVANDANGNGNAGGDKIVYSSSPINEASTVGLKEVSTSILNLFPNPANDKVSIELENNKNSKLTIYNMNGQKVMSSSFNSAHIQLNVSDLEQGLYYISIDQDNKKLSKALWKM